MGCAARVGKARDDVLTLLLQQTLDQHEIVPLAGVGAVGRAVQNALGDLRHGHATGGQIFHQSGMDARLAGQAVDTLGAPALQPAFQVFQHHAGVAARAFNGYGAVGHTDVDGEIVRVGHVGRRGPSHRTKFLKRFGSGVHVEDVRHPGAQKTLFRFPLLVGSNPLRGHLVDVRIGARQWCGHTANRHRATLQADGHQTPENGGEEVGGLDIDAEAVRPYRRRVGHDVLENAGLEIPARGVETGRVGTQGVQHFLHLIGGGERFDQDDGADDGVAEKRQAGLAGREEVTPEGGLVGRLQLGQVEVDALSAFGLRPAGVEQGERRAENRRRYRLAVDRHVRLVEMQAALTVHEERQVAFGQAILAAAAGVGKGQRAFHRRQAVPCCGQGIDQPVAGGVFVIVQVAGGTRALGPRVQRVDEHVGDGGGPRDFDAGAFQLLGDRRHLPIAGVGVRHRGMGGQHAVFQSAAQHLGAAGAQRLDARRKCLVHVYQIIEKGIAENLRRSRHRSECHALCRPCLCHVKGLPAS